MPLARCSGSIALLVGALGTSHAAFAQSNRGYNDDSLEQGQKLYAQHCSVCHGANAESSVTNWHQRDENGRFPPPPLNGTAHTWHHSLDALVQTIQNGTEKKGGGMPAWRDTLSRQETLSVIMWLTSLWPDEIFAAWLQRNQQ